MTSNTATAELLHPRASAAENGAEASDESLFEAYQQGQISAFHQLVRRHHKPVYRFCLRALGSPAGAEDATQEVFLRVVKYAPKWERKAKFTTWLYTIARNYCIDEARKGRFRRTESLNAPAFAADGESGTERIDQVEAETLPSDRVTESVRMRQAIDSAVQALPEDQREVFCLREYSGMAFKEIAQMVGVGENTIKSRMRYALVFLRKSLESQGFYPPDSS